MEDRFKRILIIGCGGSGKSKLAEQLHQKLNLSIIHLDQHYWKPNWVESQKGDWELTVNRLIQAPEWIMDGNYGGTMDLRIERADTIIFLYFPTITCIYRVVKRTIKYWGKTRPSMPRDCPERLNLEFLHYVQLYNRTRASSILDKLKKIEKEKNIFILRNDKDVKNFLIKT